MILQRLRTSEKLFILACDAGLRHFALLFKVLRLKELLSKTARVAMEITDLTNKIGKLPLYRLDWFILGQDLLCKILVDQFCLLC